MSQTNGMSDEIELVFFLFFFQTSENSLSVTCNELDVQLTQFFEKLMHVKWNVR